jgi:Family of unknown function (DUF6298)
MTHAPKSSLRPLHPPWRHRLWPGWLALLMAGVAASPAHAVMDKKPWVTLERNGALAYRSDAEGNRIPDFSAAGYGGGGVPLPRAAVQVVVTPVAGDNGPRIQAALDYVASLPVARDGLRGAVLLARGRYEIAGQLRLTAGGVVLRGQGDGPDGTVLVASGDGRRTLIVIAGRSDAAETARPVAVTDAYVPVGATALHVADAAGLRVGQEVRIGRPSPENWIRAVGMDQSPGPTPFQWRPGTVNLSWDRIVTAVDGDRVTLDAPITTALDRKFGGATLAACSWPGRIEQVGVENLRCESAFDASNPADEEHAWDAIDLDAVQNAWVDRVTAVHFAGSCVDIGPGGKWITVEDCASLAPVSELAGYRRHTFLTNGQLTLFLRCRSEAGRRDFSAGYQAAGPNVFLECRADRTHGASGSIGSWASGLLFDNVAIDGGALRLDNLETADQGIGWSVANSVAWQCNASLIVCREPPTAHNWAIGVWGQFLGDGVWQLANEFVRPESLYRAQLAARRGDRAPAALAATDFAAAGAASTPTLEQAVPDLARRLAPPAPPPGRPLALAGGWLTANGSLLTGQRTEVAWWRGQLAPARAAGEAGPSLTRFVPGRPGPGLTDNLADVAAGMVRRHQVAIEQHYGLWYDRRRDGHERVRQIDADVWPPFYELPWARTGRGHAWNGLSLYDLTRFNPWYFRRLREFAGLARQDGLVLIDEMYFQHNILEAGAHWVDFPWRPANCIQATGFPEPPPFRDTDGAVPPTPDLGKRIFMAPIFYDLSNPVRRALNRDYIRQCLANLADEPNVIHTIGEEFTGPLPFVQYWLDVIGAWEAETGRHPLIGLSVPKDVQDAILADPKRRRLISVIDLKYWWQTSHGLFAPKGGENLSPRQSERQWKGGRPTAVDLAAMARAYRSRFPDKAVITPLEQGDGWAFAAAGGSLPALPATTDPRLLAALPQMQPAPAATGDAADTWTLAEPGRQRFVYAAHGGPIAVDLRGESGQYTVYAVDLRHGSLPAAPATVAAGAIVTIPAPPGRPAAVWLTR